MNMLENMMTNQEGGNSTRLNNMGMRYRWRDARKTGDQEVESDNKTQEDINKK